MGIMEAPTIRPYTRSYLLGTSSLSEMSSSMSILTVSDETRAAPGAPRVANAGYVGSEYVFDELF